MGIPPFYKDDQNEMMHSVLNDPLVLSQGIPRDARILVRQLLEKDPSRRLGSHKGFDEVKKNSWFSLIDWESVLKRNYEMEQPDPSEICLFQMD